MTTVTLEEAHARLPSLIAGLKPSEELLITDQDRTIARLILEPAAKRQPRQPGSAVGKLTILSEDEEHLEDFKEYMP